MKFIKLSPDAILPTRATKASAGYDFHAHETVTIEPGAVQIVKTGISFEGMPANQYLQLQLRSSVSIKRPFLMANGVGIIDADYAGNEIGIILYNRGSILATVDKGEKIAQGVLLQYHTATEKAPTKKRTGGYGSTDSAKK